jgi:hypothetical protein
MKKGDLVQKVRGYGYDQNWTGVVLRILRKSLTQTIDRVEVLTIDGIEEWVTGMIEVINEDRRYGKNKKKKNYTPSPRRSPGS